VNRWSRASLDLALKIVRRLKESAGLVPGFADVDRHLWMLTDEARAAAFEKAIESAVVKGDVVVDVGAGTGLLSMMACRAGASRVYAIEETRVIDLAMVLARENGFADRIVFVHGNSREVSLPERADRVVSETIGSFVFSEDLLPTMVDARERFLKPGGTLIPHRIVIRIVPIESFEEGTGFWERPLRGFNYTAAASRVAVGVPSAARTIRRSHFLAGEQVLYDLDLRSASATMEFARTVEFTAHRDGRLHGFVASWEAELHDEITLRCGPEMPPLHWPVILFRLPRGLPVVAGDRIALTFKRKDAPGWVWSWSAEVNRAAPGD